MRVELKTPQGLKTIGWIVEESGGLVLEKNVSRLKHLLRVANAWGVQVEVFQKHPDLSLIRLHEVESGKIYEIPVHLFRELAFERDHGHGRQLFVHRSLWATKPRRMTRPSKPAARPVSQESTGQMALL